MKMRWFRLTSVLALVSAVPGFAQKTGTIDPSTYVDPPSICDAISGNLVSNCGFETGDFSNWNTSNLNATLVVGAGFDGYNPNSGNLFAALGNVGVDGEISQTLATTPGDTYQITFYYASNGTTPSYFEADFGSTVLTQITDGNSGSAYQQFTFTETATSSSTALQFLERNDPSYDALDDISVVAVSSSVPEPTSISLLMTGIGLIGWKFRSRTRRNIG